LGTHKIKVQFISLYNYSGGCWRPNPVEMRISVRDHDGNSATTSSCRMGKLSLRWQSVNGVA